MVYCIRHRTNGRVYIGSSVSFDARMRAHRRSPPKRMQQDASAGPFQELFEVEILERCSSEAHARHLEGKLIRQFAATGPRGYNNLPGTPATSIKWFALKKFGKI